MYSLASCRQTECMVMIRILSWETNSCKYLSDRSKKSSGRPTHVGAMYSQSVFLACWKVAIYSAQIFLGENGGGHKNIFVKIHRQNIYIHVRCMYDPSSPILEGGRGCTCMDMNDWAYIGDGPSAIYKHVQITELHYSMIYPIHTRRIL